jgi:hypothetical protein
VQRCVLDLSCFHPTQLFAPQLQVSVVQACLDKTVVQALISCTRSVLLDGRQRHESSHVCLLTRDCKLSVSKLNRAVLSGAKSPMGSFPERFWVPNSRTAPPPPLHVSVRRRRYASLYSCSWSPPNPAAPPIVLLPAVSSKRRSENRRRVFRLTRSRGAPTSRQVWRLRAISRPIRITFTNF